MRWQHLSWGLFAGYVAALVFGAAGITVALARPDLWVGNPLAVRVYAFGMQWGGVAYIVLGALAIAAWSWHALGPRRTVIFFLFSTSVSLAAELIGTSTGWPFGNYAYTSGLGPKVLGRVPFTIPLSWFTVGLASYLLGQRLRQRYLPQYPTWLAVPLGAGLLVVWDLVLDPAMAHESMQARFWVWHQTGPYFGMPWINFVGWALTGFLFMSLAHRAWRRTGIPDVSTTFPYAVYMANLTFASMLCLPTGLWQPVIFALLAGALPATAALGHSRPSSSRFRAGELGEAPSLLERVSWRFLRALAGLLLRRRRLEVHGLANLPTSGPAILAVQHVHHLDDGCALLRAVPYPLHILVALDWVPSPRWRWLMERLCRWAGWPVIVRPAEMGRPGNQYSVVESRIALLRGIREAVARLEAGQYLVVFPEGYPLIDPHLPGRRGPQAALYPGAVWLARRAARTRGCVPVVPIRLHYEADCIRLSIEAPLSVRDGASLEALDRALAARLGSVPVETTATVFSTRKE